MPYSLVPGKGQIPTPSGTLALPLAIGQTLFVLGANGTGKSSLLQRLAATGETRIRRISASRQTWFASSSLEFSPAQKLSYEQSVRQWDTQENSRWMENNAQFRSSLTLYDLIDAENIDARTIASAMRSGDEAEARRLAQKIAPLAKINELLSLSNLPISVAVENGDKLVASRNGGPPYGAAELSDGERNALLIAADVLTSKPGTLLLIDEPERHLHRSIISPLLSELFRYRNDCAFTVGTHDLMLPVDNPDAQVLLVRSCSYVGNRASAWDVDLIPANADVDESVKREIVGSRRKIIFVEGTESSLDIPLYSILFAGVSVRARGSSRGVEDAVRGIRAANTLHWLNAWGIIDRDGRNIETVLALQNEGIWALAVYSVEGIYYHPDLISAVSQRHAAVTGGDGSAKAQAAIVAAVEAVAGHLPRMAARAVEKTVRRTVLSSMPTLRQIERGEAVHVSVDVNAVVETERAKLAAAVEARDWLHILERCPVRETPALDSIARYVGFQDRHQYEAGVLQALRDDPATLANARSIFGSMPDVIMESGTLPAPSL